MRPNSPRLYGAAVAVLAVLLSIAPRGAHADSTTVFNEIHYHPADPADPEWIELHNLMAVDMDLSEWRIAGGVNFDFPAGTVILARGYLVLSDNPGALEAATGLSGVLGPWAGSLSNGGESLRLRNNSNRLMDELDYRDSGRWPVGADGSGATLAKRDANAASGDPASWTASPQADGTPASLNFINQTILGPEQTLLAPDDSWLYNESGADLGANWAQSAYSDGVGGWQSGQGAIGFDNANLEEPIRTQVADPETSGVVTYYFQKQFTFSGVPGGVELEFDALVDDGAVFYLNGVEVARINMPAGPVDASTNADGHIGNARYNGPVSLPTTNLINGSNTLSVSVHQAASVARAVVLGGNGGLVLAEEGGEIEAANNLAPAGTAFAKDLIFSGAFPAHTIPHLNDGLFGNANSWIGDTLNSFCGVSLGATAVSLQSIAFGRDNLGAFTDRTFGVYTLEYTTDPNPDENTSNWTQIGTLDYQSPGGANFAAPSSRHRYNFDEVMATGIRLTVPGAGLGSGACIDEIELYAEPGEITKNKVPQPVDLNPEAGFELDWDGNNGDFFDPTAPPGGAVVPDNIALASGGVVPFGSGELGGIHFITTVNDGFFGNSNSWIGAAPPGQYIGLDFGGLTSFSRIAWGRDNGNNVADACGGQCMDRSLGTYTLQFTTVASPGVGTAETGIAGTGWQTIGSFDYNFRDPTFTEYLRHEYTVTTDTGGLIEATGIRIKVPNPGIAVDEIEVYGPVAPDVAFATKLSYREVITPPEEVALEISEISGSLDATFGVEIRNTGGAAVDLTGYTLVATGLNGGTYAFPSQSLMAGAILAVSPAALGFHPDDGARLFLYGPAQSLVIDAVEVDDLPRARSAAHGGRFLVPDAPTFGAANTFAITDDVVINEIMYHFRPDPGSPGTPAVTNTTSLLTLDSTWRYNDTGADLGAGWEDTAHTVDNVAWFSGQGLIGFEDTGALPDTLRTVLEDPDNNDIITYYFETDFTIGAAQLASLDELQLSHVICDGAVFYLNGVEVLRYNMPAGPVTAATLAASAVGDGGLVGPVALPTNKLVVGSNRLSVELHQASLTSSDMVLGAALDAAEILSPAVPPTALNERDEEWIELFNKSGAPVDLTAWSLDGGIGFDFAPGTTIPAGGYLVVARNAAVLSAKYPAATIVGDFSGRLNNSRDRIELEDALGNPVDLVSYVEGGKWPDLADGDGASLELRDVDADNANPGAWAASDESDDLGWQTYTYRQNGAQAYGLTTWNELRLGMLRGGEVLVDDISVVRDPDGAAQELLQNGDFEAAPGDDKWRFLGNHRHSSVIVDPDDAGNSVLHFIATGGTDTRHNHLETTFVGNTAISPGQTYEVSFRARWLRGGNQLNINAFQAKIARTFPLPMPEFVGTPGAVNGAAEPNIGPTISNLAHDPIVPAANEPVTISADIADPDGLGTLVVRTTLNGLAGPSATLIATGVGDGYEAALPGQTAGTVVQFWIEAADGLGAISMAPAAGPDSRALYHVEDGTGVLPPLLSVPLVRLIMLPADRDFMFNVFNVMSNERLGSTVVVNGIRAHYDTGVRLRGSGAGRARDGDNYISYNIGFPADDLFRGVHGSIGIDRSGRSPAARQQDEIYVKHMFNHAGVPCMYDDLAYFISPRTVHNGTAIMQMARYGGVFVQSQFPNGDRGGVFNLDITYDPNTGALSVPGNVESLKRPTPFTHIGTDFTNLGDDKEQYRGPFELRTGARRDDFSGLIDLCQTMALPTAQLDAQIEDVMDVDEWMRYMAMTVLCGIGDTFVNGGLRHNIRVFVPEEGQAVALPWDSDFVFSAGTTSPMITGSGNLRRILDRPQYRRLYWGHVHDLVANTFNTAYMDRWLEHYGNVVGQNFIVRSGYIASRGASALSQCLAAAPNVPFAVTTNGGNDFSVPETQATLEGNGWVNIREFRLAGSDEALEVVWTDGDSWQLQIPLLAGPNPITLETYDFQGALLDTHSMTITSTVVAPTPPEFLRITELHYNPAAPSGAELLVSTNNDDYEFVELRNIGSDPLDISGVTFTTGLTFTFAPGTVLQGGEFILVVSNEAAFEARYGNALNVAGEYAPTNLANSGEPLELRDASGNLIHQFAYDDAWLPASDGHGYSMCVIDQNAPVADWNLRTQWGLCGQGGTPGVATECPGTQFEAWQQTHFSAAEQDDVAISGNGADPNFDGTTNLLAYAFARAAGDNAPANTLATTSLVANRLRITFTRWKFAPDLQYLPQVSDDLESWTGGLVQVGVPVNNGDGTETVTFEDSTPISGRRYGRVEVVWTPLN